MIARVVVETKTSLKEEIFDYLVPEELKALAAVGQRVTVPFGQGDSRYIGYIVSLEGDKAQELKYIINILDYKPLLNRQRLVEAFWLKSRYFCTFAEAIRLFMPVGAAALVKETVSLTGKDGEMSRVQQDIVSFLKTHDFCDYKLLSEQFGQNIRKELRELQDKKIISLSYSGADSAKSRFMTVAALADASFNPESLKKNAAAQKRVVKVLSQCEFLSIPDLCMFAGCSASTVNSMADKGIVIKKQIKLARSPYKLNAAGEESDFVLTKEQERVLETLRKAKTEGSFRPVLLHGITGSGKTEVYIRAIEEVLAEGGSAIVLVPEISLTHQMVSRFIKRFGKEVALLHSKLSDGERYDEWMRIKNGAAGVVIGARSAVFAPCRQLKLIVVDEEHEDTYKSGSGVRYDAREVAMMRAKSEGGMVLLSSATPSVENYFRAKSGGYILCEMNNRYNGVSLPETTVADMREELRAGNRSPFSMELKEAIRSNIEAGEQTILLLNRRGYSTFVSCRSCGFVGSCPNCNISLTYHSHGDYLLCHYCGHREVNPSRCPECGSDSIRGFGTGTQKIEEKLYEEFGDVSVIRMDVDTTSKKNSHEKVLDTFENEKVNILLGTQMISKGLDFKNVTLVGVLAADQILNMGDFRAGEKTFDLITQVCGRSGRGEKRGRAIIQSYMPENPVIRFASRHDYHGFYDEEITARRALNYPPFCNIVNITITGDDEREVREGCAEMQKKTAQALEGIAGITLYRSAPCYINKIKNKYRWHFWLKCVFSKEIHTIISELARQEKKLAVTVDLNPVSM